MTRHLRELKEKINAGRILLEDCKQNFYFMKEGDNMTFNIDNYPIGSKTVMHCSTEAEARRFLNFLDSYGVRWSDNGSLVEYTAYDRHHSETCYNFTFNMFRRPNYRVVKVGDVCFYKEEGFKILESTDFDFDSEEDDLCACEDIGDFLNSLIAK